ncbi:MAG TPA: hypothetical protein VJS42_05160 [Steroidobacteraceae bacterium]|nr:hypothetical protein [Steroidobacteraceae bacterium]
MSATVANMDTCGVIRTVAGQRCGLGLVYRLQVLTVWHGVNEVTQQ